METKKSTEQIALEEYIWKTRTAKFSKDNSRIGLISGSITYIICVILTAYGSLLWNNGSAGIIISLFLCCIPAGTIAVTLMAFHFFFSGLYRGKRKTRKIIANLSREEKKKITKDYLESEINKWKKSLSINKNKIISIKKSIGHHKLEIEKLESELNNL